MLHWKLFLCALFFAPAVYAQSFTIGTQNLYHWMKDYDNRVSKIKEEVKLGVPEIMAFQEAAEWKSGKSMFKEFIKTTNFTPHYRVTNSLGIMQEGIGFGSLKPPTNCQDFELPATTFNSRQWINTCEFTTAIGTIKVINAHTTPGPWATSNRTKQIQFMVDYVVKMGPTMPVLVVGDLNDEYGTESFEPLKKLGFVDIMNGLGATYDSTQNPYATYSRIARLDYIFYHPGQLNLVRAGFMFKQNLISDHYGLKAEFSLPKPLPTPTPSPFQKTFPKNRGAKSAKP